MMKLKELILVVVMMGVLFATAFANDNDESRLQRSELMKERMANFKENIKPKIDAQRNKLETSISAEDKSEIARLRQEIMKQRLIENEFLFETRAARIKGEEFDEGLWQEIEAQKIVIENLQDQAKLIANKYRPEIDGLVADLREELSEERRNNAHERNGSNEAFRKGKRGRGNGDNFRADGQRHGSYRFDGRADFHRGFGPQNFGPNMNIVTFLLWDVNRG